MSKKLVADKFFRENNKTESVQRLEGDELTNFEAELDRNCQALLDNFVKAQNHTTEKTICDLTRLHIAAFQADLALIQTMLALNPNELNVTDAEGFTPLHCAVLAGVSSVVEHFLFYESIDVNAKSKAGLTPLHIATIINSLEVVEALLSSPRIDVNLTSADGSTALHIALLLRHVEIVGELLKVQNLNVNAKTFKKLTPLEIARQLNEENLIKLLLGKGAVAEGINSVNKLIENAVNSEEQIKVSVTKTVETMKSKFGIPSVAAHKIRNLLKPLNREPISDIDKSLFQATIEGKLESIKSFVANGANVTKTLKSGATILNFAIISGNLEVFKYFVEEHNLKVSTTNDLKEMNDICNLSSKYFLYFAAEMGSLGLLKYLIEVVGLSPKSKFLGQLTLLCPAVTGKHFDIVKYLIEDVGASVNIKNGNCPLCVAIGTKNLAMVKYLLSKGANIYSNGNRPIFIAANRSSLEIFKYLLNFVDIDVKNNKGFSVFDSAIDGRNFEIIKYLIEEDKFQFKARHQKIVFDIVENESLETVKYFFEQKIFSSFAMGELYNDTILHKAVCNNNLDVIKYFVEDLGLDINARDDRGYTPLSCAVLSNNLAAVKYFVQDKKINIHLKDKAGKTVLHLAAGHGSLEMVQYLVEECNANLNEKDSSGHTPLISLARKRSFFRYRIKMQEATIEYLVKQGANLNVLTKCHGNILHLVADQGNMKLIRMLVEEKGMSVNIRDLEGQTALLRAGEAGQLEAVRYFLENGAIVTDRSEYSFKNILHLVASRGNVELIKCLIDEKRMQANTEDMLGRTPIFYAAEAGQLDAVKYFVESKNIDVNIKCTNNETLLFPAIRSNNSDLVKYLIERGVDSSVHNSGGMTAQFYAGV